ncbi:MAG: 2-C-methyl-D-erythritol 4-phosphate cytidylyltransferase [Syntrophobacteraceae bacterium]|nr:2-C-methyl-D-erythritol 4-phosphate cytidylyltransferase [Syntrophobacteraceae bacterium]
MNETCVIVPAAGSGVRMGGPVPKQFLELAGRPILAHTLSGLSRLAFVSMIVLVVGEGYEARMRELVGQWRCGQESGLPEVFFAAGGKERSDSVCNALEMLPGECEWVMIHDGVRPFASAGLMEAVWEGARATGACVAAVAATDTVKLARDGIVRQTLARDEVWLVQTPQVFDKRIVTAAYKRAVLEGWAGTDDASFVERMGVAVSIVQGERTNIKVTSPQDLRWAEWYLGAMASGRGSCG